AAHAGDLETAEASLAQAAGLIQATPMLLAQCRTLTAYGWVLARRWQRGKARQVLADALQQAQACGAGWHAGHALTELRRAASRCRARRGPGAAPAASRPASSARRRRPWPGSPGLGGPTGKSATSCTCRSTPWRRILRTPTASSASTGAASWLARRSTDQSRGRG